MTAAAREHGVGADAIALAVTYDAGLDERLAGLAEPPADYWAERAGLDWN